MIGLYTQAMRSPFTQTQQTGDATRIVEDSGSALDRIVCCGGDGTLNECGFGGLLELDEHPDSATFRRVRQMILLTASVIPKKALDAAEIGFEERFPKSVDVGLFAIPIFVYVAGFGAFTEVAIQRRRPKNTCLDALPIFWKASNHFQLCKPYEIQSRKRGRHRLRTNSFSAW